MDNLEKARKIIDDCDQKIVAIFEERLEAVLEVLAYKKEHKLSIFQPEREENILKKINSYLTDEQYSGELESLYKQILKISRKLQSKKMFPFNIVLIGFMGSGKSSVGKELASLLEMDYVDTDELITQNAKISINEIFSTSGEAGFRRLERDAIASLRDVKNTVIACGGGAVLVAENVEILKDNGKLVWLQVSPLEVTNRLKADTQRPLLKDMSNTETLVEMLGRRLPIYNEISQIKIDTDDKETTEIAKEIIEKLLAL